MRLPKWKCTESLLERLLQEEDPVVPCASAIRSGGGRRSRRRCSLANDQEFKRFPIDLELHLTFVEGELDRCVQGNEGLIRGLRLTNRVVGGAGADDILLAKKIDVLLLGFLCATRD